MLIGCSEKSSLMIELSKCEEVYLIKKLGKGPYIAKIKKLSDLIYNVIVCSKYGIVTDSRRGANIRHLKSKNSNNNFSTISFRGVEHKNIVAPHFFKRTVVTDVIHSDNTNMLICVLEIPKENLITPLIDKLTHSLIEPETVPTKIPKNLFIKADKDIIIVPEDTEILTKEEELLNAVNIINNQKRALFNTLIIKTNEKGFLQIYKEIQ